MAARHGNAEPEAVDVLIETGVDVDFGPYHDESPLYLACLVSAWTMVTLIALSFYLTRTHWWTART